MVSGHGDKAAVNGLVGQVLAGPLFLKVKNKIPFYKKQIINKSGFWIFLLYYDTVDRKSI